MNSEQLLLMLPNSTIEERTLLDSLIKDKSEEERAKFITQYILMRKDPQQILICTLLGFIGIAGVQRFVVDEILLGLVYFFTGGFCVIGTIVDLIRYKEITFEFNKKIASKVYQYQFKA